MSGKGSKPRPFSIDAKTFEDNWNLIFKKKEKKSKFIGTKFRCKTCNTILFSSYSGEWVSCECGCFVDQTEHYTRLSGDLEEYKEN